jgi:hypothetical protein
MKTDDKMNEHEMTVPHYRTPNEIHDMGLRMAEIAVYAVLCRYCNPGTEAWPSYTRIAERAGCSRPTAIKAIKRLIKIGLVGKTRRRIGADLMNSNLYEINHDIQSLYLKLAPDKHDTSPDNLNSGKARLLPLVKALYQGGKRDCQDKELPIKNDLYKELSTGNFQGENPLLSYKELKSKNLLGAYTDQSISYFMGKHKAFTGKEHVRLRLSTWQDVAESLLKVEVEHNKVITIDVENLIPMVNHYFSKDYNNGNCNRCITHFNHPEIKKVNYYEAAYYGE